MAGRRVTNQAITEAAARAIYENDYIDGEPAPDRWVELTREDPPFTEYYRKQAEAVLDTVTPLIRNAALEEAAMMAEAGTDYDSAAAIRALKSEGHAEHKEQP